MSRFYGTLSGQAKTEATRRGSENSPVYAHVRGWNVGATVKAYVGPDGEDHISISLTSGSNGHEAARELGDFTRADLTKKKRR